MDRVDVPPELDEAVEGLLASIEKSLAKARLAGEDSEAITALQQIVSEIRTILRGAD